MKLPLTITFEALSHMKKILSVDKPIILIGVKGGGCNGMKYFIKAIDKPEKSDDTFIQDDVQLAVCGKSLIYMLGTHIFMSHDVLGSRIEFENPNATSKCGCGETFNI
tara:strand:- start:269 stop:592 length:324 start_codon:yes stop_codon:yes gene_type:complete